jgi:hypothetical protein
MKRTFYLLILVCLLISITTLNNCKKEEQKNLPSLITVAVSGITKTSALLGGFIIDDGGAEVIARGVCWGTEPNPVNSKTINGKGIGTFISSLTGLNPNTLYYARAYATNSEGTAYGNEVQFTTNPAAAATVVTKGNYIISYYSATVSGQVTDDGGVSVTEKGICWATRENPTIINNEKTIYDLNITGAYKVYWCDIYPLQPKSVYHVRAYAINSVDTSYGDDVSITTLAVPEVTTVAVTEITSSSATIGGNVTSIGNASNVEIGICYGKYKNPTVMDLHIKAGTTGTGEFTCNLTNLTPGTLYYARAYVYWFDEVYNEYDVYGNEVTFTTH